MSHKAFCRLAIVFAILAEGFSTAVLFMTPLTIVSALAFGWASAVNTWSVTVMTGLLRQKSKHP